MNIKFFASTLLALTLVGCGGGGGGGSSTDATQVAVVDPYPKIVDASIQNKFAIKSVNVVLNSDSLLGLPGWVTMDDHIKNIKALGANDVKIALSAGYYDLPTDNRPNTNVNFNPSDAELLTFLRKIKSAGLTVTMQPVVHKAIQTNGNLLSTVHSTPTDFNEWISNHTTSMARLATIAEQASVDRFVVIGDEVQHLAYEVNNQVGWLNLITDIRRVYKGQLTTVIYSDGTLINGQSHVDMIGSTILNKVDTIGIGWFPKNLTNTNNPTISELISGWRSNAGGVDTIRFFSQLNQRYNKPVWISDIAIHSFDGDNISPDNIYNYQLSLTPDEQEQADQYESLLTVLSYNTNSWFLGLSVDSYNNFPSNYVTSRHLSSPYSEEIRGKLAEGVIRKWYRQKMN